MKKRGLPTGAYDNASQDDLAGKNQSQKAPAFNVRVPRCGRTSFYPANAGDVT